MTDDPRRGAGHVRHPAITHVAVVVPARDEADTIAAAIRSVDAARHRLPHGVTTDCVVAVDAASRDSTGELARHEVGTAGLVIERGFGSVGAARRMGTEAALRRRPSGAGAMWIASTDADSVVPSGWLRDQVAVAAQGAAAVAGIVELLDAAPELSVRFGDRYPIGPDGTHGHVHGANLGMRADAYVAAGGWRDLSTGEDHDLWRRLRAAVDGVVHTTAIVVGTSARITGRAPAGFAADLRDLEITA